MRPPRHRPRQRQRQRPRWVVEICTRAVVIAASASLCSCSTVSPESYVDLVEASRACETTDECTLAGAGDCTCPAPINRSAEPEVTEAAAEVDCQNATSTMCPMHENLRCEQNRCITDDSP